MIWRQKGGNKMSFLYQSNYFAAKFHNSDAEVKCYISPLGTGGTTSTVAESLLYCQKQLPYKNPQGVYYSKAKFVITGRSQSDIEDSVIPSLERLTSSEHFTFRKKSKNNIPMWVISYVADALTYDKNRRMYIPVIVNGKTIPIACEITYDLLSIIGRNSLEAWKSREFDGAIVSEVSKMEHVLGSDYLFAIKERLRGSHHFTIRNGKTYRRQTPQMLIESNAPPDECVDFWNFAGKPEMEDIKDLLVNTGLIHRKKLAEGIYADSFWAPSVNSMAALKLGWAEYMGAGDSSYYQQFENRPTNIKDRLLNNQITKGDTIYKYYNFYDELHVVNRVPFNISNRRVWVGCDEALSGSAVFLAIHDDIIYQIDEVYIPGKSLQELGLSIAETARQKNYFLQGIYCDTAINARDSGTGIEKIKSMNMGLKKGECLLDAMAVPASFYNNFEKRLNIVNHYFDNNSIYTKDKRKFLILNTCTNTIEHIHNYRSNKTIEFTERKASGKDKTVPNHLAEAIPCAIYGIENENKIEGGYLNPDRRKNKILSRDIKGPVLAGDVIFENPVPPVPDFPI